jgi:hypothetical protein
LKDFWSNITLNIKRTQLPNENQSHPRRFHRWKNKIVQAEGHGHWLDIWLPRISHFLQFGLFVITLGSLYFVVLPLYQKAVLDEAIAKKEVELREVSAALEESYRRVRESTVKDFVLGAGLNCSGLMLPPQIGTQVPNRKPDAQEILEIDPKKCLVEASAHYPGLRSLRVEDMAILQEAIASFAQKLNKNRFEIIDKSKSSWNSKQRNDNAHAYSEFVLSRIDTLRTLTWKQH